jgi:hypothetical protein
MKLSPHARTSVHSSAFRLCVLFLFLFQLLRQRQGVILAFAGNLEVMKWVECFLDALRNWRSLIPGVGCVVIHAPTASFCTLLDFVILSLRARP